jgi:succinoglycan biosynthesis transport protein ExoP
MEHPPVRPDWPEDIQRSTMKQRAVRHLPAAPPYLEIDTGQAGGDEVRKWLEYWNLLTLHKFALLVATTCGVIVAFLVSLVQTPVYVAWTTLEIQNTERPPFEGISFLNRSDAAMLQTQVQLLQSRTLQDRVSTVLADKARDTSSSSTTGLGSIREWLRLSAPTGPQGWPGAIGSARESLRVAVLEETPIVQVTTQSTIPQAASDYVNTLAEVFIEHNQEQRWSLYQSTGAWLERAQEELKTKLEESEKQLVEYARGSGLVLSFDTQNIGEQKFIDLQTELTKAQAERITKEALYRTALSGQEQSAISDSGVMGSYEMKIGDLRRELADAMTVLTEAHPKVKRLQAQITELESAKAREGSNIIGRMRAEFEAYSRREQELRTELDTQSKALSDQDGKLVRYKMLQREVETYRKIYETTLQAGKEAGLASALRPVNARLIDAARPADTPSSPNLQRNLTIGLLSGLLFGVAFVLIRERADRSIRQPGALPLHSGLRELGIIPSAKMGAPILIGPGRKLPFLHAAVESGKVRRSSETADPVELASWHRRDAQIAESFRATVTSILMSWQERQDSRVILVTSPSPKEGKSTVVTNLAIALAEVHRRVLLIDADLRRPRIHTILGQANTWGLSDLLQDHTPCAEYAVEALGRRTDVPGLFSLPSGAGTTDSLRMLYSERLGELLERLRREFDTILIDTPPVLSVADARILSRLADAIVLVVRSGKTTRESAAMAVNVFEADGVQVLGTVLNDWSPRGSGNGYYSDDYARATYGLKSSD